MDFGYPTEKLSDARRILMLPHPNGEADSLAHAFHECSLGLRQVDDTQLDDNARTWVQTIRKAMDTSGLKDAFGRGLWSIKAERLSEMEKSEFANAVDALAYWFEARLRTQAE